LDVGEGIVDCKSVDSEIKFHQTNFVYLDVGEGIVDCKTVDSEIKFHQTNFVNKCRSGFLRFKLGCDQNINQSSNVINPPQISKNVIRFSRKTNLNRISLSVHFTN